MRTGKVWCTFHFLPFPRSWKCAFSEEGEVSGSPLQTTYVGYLLVLLHRLAETAGSEIGWFVFVRRSWRICWGWPGIRSSICKFNLFQQNISELFILYCIKNSGRVHMWAWWSGGICNLITGPVFPASQTRSGAHCSHCKFFHWTWLFLRAGWEGSCLLS